MAQRYSMPDKPGCHTRQLKVRESYHDYQLQQSSIREPVPWVQLKGYWLKQAGFNVNTPVKVRVMKGCLVITTE